MRKILLSCILLFSTSIGIGTIFAQDPVVITMYTREGCPHCAAEKKFLTTLKKEIPIDVKYVEITEPDGMERFKTFAKSHDLPLVTPITQIGEKIIIGFDAPKTTGKDIRDAIAMLTKPDSKEETYPVNGDTVRLPWIGEINLKEVSLVSISAILGLIDGFNPCAMWALITFLLVLINLGDRKKMIQVAGIFLLAETIMYFLILNVWLKTWNFVRLDSIVTPLVGLVAIGGGGFFLWEAWKNDGTCHVTNAGKRSKITQQIKYIASQPMTLITLGSILLLAFSINIIEFACSIGIPQTFTKILDLNNIGLLSRQLYIGIYMLGYMTDDLIVFTMAIASFQMIHHSQKLTFYSQLLGGILMILLGLILIYNRSLLVF